MAVDLPGFGETRPLIGEVSMRTLADAVSRIAQRALFSAHPWQLSPEITLEEMRGFVAAPCFDELLH
ncbi:hypothetical protein NDI47_12530 [Microcoleus vaginatus GB1-A2]|uniref:hypothetical protein n=1 Tax=Microcoleus vaginatus TaxID=119532 RepID=UPI001689B9F8|nr:hypothetical protein [Microcoleus sp. FACHB-61]